MNSITDLLDLEDANISINSIDIEGQTKTLQVCLSHSGFSYRRSHRSFTKQTNECHRTILYINSTRGT